MTGNDEYCKNTEKTPRTYRGQQRSYLGGAEHHKSLSDQEDDQLADENDQTGWLTRIIGTTYEGVGGDYDWTGEFTKSFFRSLSDHDATQYVDTYENDRT